MNVFDYDSSEWKEERQRALACWDGYCDWCRDKDDYWYPHVHHTRGTHVEEYDIICPICHAEHHNNPSLKYVGIKKGAVVYNDFISHSDKKACTVDYTDISHLLKGNCSLEQFM